MKYSRTHARLSSVLMFVAGVSICEPCLCDAGRVALDRYAKPTKGLVLEDASDAKALNGSYGDGQRTLRFETMRFFRERPAGQPTSERDYDIALRVIDPTGRVLLLLAEGGHIPRQWRQNGGAGRERPIEPEMFRLAQEAAQAVKELKLPKELAPEQALLVQQLATFAASAKQQPPTRPPGQPPGK